MEASPQPNTAERPELRIELVGTDGSMFAAIARTQELLEGDELAQFNAEVATALGVGMKQYHEVLGIIGQHVDLRDTSGMYEAYAPKQPEA